MLTAPSNRHFTPLKQSDCVPRALSNATGLPYDECYERMSVYRRRYRHGWNLPLAAAIHLVLPSTYGCEGYAVNAKTLITLPEEIPRGNFIIQVRGHVLAMVNGEVIDWAAGRRFRVREVCRVWKRPE